MENILPTLPSIPAKRYFTIGEVGDLCGVKPHVLRYWEQEFTQLRPMKRSGNRRYYQRHEVLMIRRIRDLLYDQGFTISGARNQLQDFAHTLRDLKRLGDASANEMSTITKSHLGSSNAKDDETQKYEAIRDTANDASQIFSPVSTLSSDNPAGYKWHMVKQELFAIRDLLGSAS